MSTGGKPAAPPWSSLSTDADGLVPAVVQDATTMKVLMVGWMNEEAYASTLSRGVVHFWSRSRQTLWMKGETSGNTLTVIAIDADCDGDTLLVQAQPAGPTCHTGRRSCFDTDDADDLQGFASLERLWATISDRISVAPEGSYTASLVAGGPNLTARKLAEEAVEVLIAAKDHAVGRADDARLTEEMADLTYHLLVVAAERRVPFRQVVEELQRRSR